MRNAHGTNPGASGAGGDARAERSGATGSPRAQRAWRGAGGPANPMNEAVLGAAREALERGETVALVTIVRARGSTPQRVGAKMLVHADGRTVGTIGGGCYEHEAAAKARVAIADRRPTLERYELADDLVSHPERQAIAGQSLSDIGRE